jgi:uncharacterized protein
MTAPLSGHICTYSGVFIDPINPDPDLIYIEDVAHALGNNCRFTGHVRKFYSVAQHSVLCTDLVPTDLRLTALMHDASEAYLSDIARPIKNQEEFSFYKVVEARLEEALAERFGLVYPYPDEIKHADNTMLLTEARDLMFGMRGLSDSDVYADLTPLDATITPWSPDEAAVMFLSTYYALVGV